MRWCLEAQKHYLQGGEDMASFLTPPRSLGCG
jgi:hypothetical protein